MIILLGQDFQSQHKQVSFQYEGKKKGFCGESNLCTRFDCGQDAFFFFIICLEIINLLL